MNIPQSGFFSATRLNLQRLVMLRIVIIICLSLVMFFLLRAAIPLHVLSLSVGLGLLGLLSVIAWWRLMRMSEITQQELFLHLLGDIAVFSLLFYFSGGYSNPFIWMYLLPITVAAVALPAGYAWFVALLSMVCYTVLMFYHVPLSHLHMHAHSGVTLDIHLVGMWLGFVMSAVIVAIFITRIGQNLRDYDKRMAEVRERVLESERMLALGTLAASAAHELGTPLATMAVVNKDLMEDFKHQPEVVSQLGIVATQIQRCKEILSSISRNAGQERAEAGNGLPLDVFLKQTLQRWRDTRPATKIEVNMPMRRNMPSIFVDRALQQAIQNLLDNAADESPDCVIFDADWDDETLKINIRDFGKGLSEEVRNGLGTPFFSSKQDEGMGLGIYLTKTILAKYEGKLSLNNHLQGGVLTSVVIPLQQLRVSVQ